MQGTTLWDTFLPLRAKVFPIADGSKILLVNSSVDRARVLPFGSREVIMTSL